MKFAAEYRDGTIGRAIARRLANVVDPDRHYKLMEICGGHTHTIYKYGLGSLLPANVELVHGPG